jgi:hypothetical protein
MELDRVNRAKCEAHGLVYDPTVHSGCVLCRRADGSASVRPAPAQAVVALPETSTSGAESLNATNVTIPLFTRGPFPWRDLGIVFRLVLAIGLALVAALISGGIDFTESDFVQQTVALSALAVVLSRFRTFRNLRWLSYGLVVGAFVFVLFAAVRQTVDEQRQEAQAQSAASARWAHFDESDPARTALSPKSPSSTGASRGGLTLNPPPLGATRAFHDAAGNLVLVFVEKPADVPGDAIGIRYMELARASLGELHAVEFGAISGQNLGTKDEVYTCPASLSLAGETMAGFLVTTRDAKEFAKVLVLAPSGKRVEVQRVVAALNGARER